MLKKTHLFPNFRIFLPLLPLVCPVLLFGCQWANPQTEMVSSGSTSPVAPPEVTQPNPQDQSPPNKIAVVIDKSVSIQANRIRAVTLNDLNPVFDLIQQYGGELALIAVCDDSNRPASRLRISQPPQFKTEQWKNIRKPTPPPDNSNAFQLLELKEQYSKNIANFNHAQTENRQLLAEHNQEIAQWKATVKQQVQEFRRELKPLLSQPLHCQSTDIWGAIKRVNLFLSEDTSIWSIKPTKYAVFISDGVDTVKRQPVSLEATEILLVNGSGSVGVFQTLPHKAFESPESAFYFLTNHTQGYSNHAK